MSVVSNFDFLSVDLDTAELYATINMAEENYAQKDYEGTLTKIQPSYLQTVPTLNWGNGIISMRFFGKLSTRLMINMLWIIFTRLKGKAIILPTF